MSSVPFFPSFRILLLAGLALTALRAQSPDHPESDNTLTLALALQRVVRHNPELAVQRFDPEIAAGLIEQAQLRPVPTLNLELENFVGTDALQGIDALAATLQASQLIERGDKRVKRVVLAENQQAMAIQQLTVRRHEWLARTAAHYVETLVAHHQLDYAQAAVALAQETLEAMELRVSSGVASSIETARAHAALATAQVEQMRRKSQLQATQLKLVAQWDGEPNSTPLPTGSIALPATLPDASALRAKLDQNPRLTLQANIIASERANLDLQQALTTSDVTIAGGVRFLRDGRDAAFVAGVSMPFPSRHTNRGNIRSARASLAGAEGSTRSIQWDLHLTFEAAWQELQSAHAAAQSLRQNALPALTAALTQIQSAYAEGQLAFVEVLSARRELAVLHQAILEHEATYAAALVQLDALTDPTFPLTQALLLSR